MSTHDTDHIDEVEERMNSQKELELRISAIKDGKLPSGPILISRDLLMKMSHTPAFACVIFNPFGPTIETVSLSSFDDPTYKAYLIRRSLHPFSEERTQIIATVPQFKEGEDNEFQRFLVRLIGTFIGNNGASSASKDVWANEMLGCIPTGVLVDKSKIFSVGSKRGFAHLLQHAEKLLEPEIGRIKKYGSRFWDATPDLSEMLELIKDKEPDVLQFPEVVDSVSIYGKITNSNFLTWWEKITEMQYQRDLHAAIKEAWYGSVHQFAGGSMLRALNDTDESGSDDADFSSWWSLFDPKKWDKQ